MPYEWGQLTPEAFPRPAGYRRGLRLAALFGLGSTLAWIPHAAFAGILIKVGWDMMDVRFLRRIPKLSPEIGIVTLLTAVLSTFVDVISAIAVGFSSPVWPTRCVPNARRSTRRSRRRCGQCISLNLQRLVLPGVACRQGA